MEQDPEQSSPFPPEMPCEVWRANVQVIYKILMAVLFYDVIL